MSADGWRRRISSAVIRLGTISENTSSSRTRRAMSWAYCAPKSTTRTGPAGFAIKQPIVGSPSCSHAGSRAVALSLSALSVAAGPGDAAARQGPASESAPPATEPSGGAPATTSLDNPFLPEEANIGDCVSSAPPPRLRQQGARRMAPGARVRRAARGDRRDRPTPRPRAQEAGPAWEPSRVKRSRRMWAVAPQTVSSSSSKKYSTRSPHGTVHRSAR